MIGRYRGTRRRRSDSRTLPLKVESRYGVGEDGNEYYRCWNCGFVCKKGRDHIGEEYEKANISYTRNYDVPYNTRMMLKPIFIGVPVDASGDTVSETGRIYDIDGDGCPFCYTKNWMGNV